MMFFLNNLKDSFNRLETEYIDLYYLHGVNEAIPVEDVAKVMGQLIDDGYIKEWVYLKLMLTH